MNATPGSLARKSGTRKSRVPARLDLMQSLSGLALALFLWTHLVLVSSILLGKDAMHFVGEVLELAFLDPKGEGWPLAVSAAGVVVSALFVLHAALAMRKLPINWRQLSTYRSHMQMMRHSDTTAWWQQAATGFVLFFLASVHLYVITTNSDQIGPYGSSDRVWSGMMWPLYLVLLFAAEVHAATGVYRLVLKWGWFEGADAKASRKRKKTLKNVMTVFFIGLGLSTLLAYMKIGYEHRDNVGEVYVPTHSAF
jgi:fumarate reductase subunit C